MWSGSMYCISCAICEAQDHNRAIREEVADAEHRCEETCLQRASIEREAAEMRQSEHTKQDARAAVRAERSSRTHAETQATGRVWPKPFVCDVKIVNPGMDLLQVREYQRDVRARILGNFVL